MNEILEKLKGGDRRSIGRANEVVQDVLQEPELFGVVFGGMLHEDALVRMRAADVVEKVTAVHPEYLAPYKETLIESVAAVAQQEVRWHVAQMVPRLPLNSAERQQWMSVLRRYLQQDESKIVKTSAMQALADLAEKDETLQPEVLALLEKHTRSGSPAMQARGRKLLAQFDNK